MNLTAEQKKYLVPASIGAAVFVLCDELLFKSKGGSRAKKGSGMPDQKTLIAAGASAVAGYFLYDKAEPATKTDLDKYALPAGAASVAYAAVNRGAATLFPRQSLGGDSRKYALGAAALGAFLTNKQLTPSSPTVGMLPIFEPPFPPAFGPNFEPEFEG